MVDQRTRDALATSASSGEFGAKILRLVRQLALWSELPEGLKCTYFSPQHKAVAAQLRDWMLSAGLDAKIDAVGNVIGRYASDICEARTLVIGSHYDTVANAGLFDAGRDHAPPVD
jgi:beta-ureidopropionase / N-carbamoyl-L-amino-acid hydrolase